MKKLIITLGILSLVVFMLLSTVNTFAQRPGNRPGKDRDFMGHRHAGFWSKLTDEQRTAVQEKIKELRDQGATREEIHAAVEGMLQSWGIELPEDWEVRPGFSRFGQHPDGVFSKLTKEQREAVHEKIKALKEQNASPEEIHTAVKQLLQGWGIEVPENWKGKPGFRRFGHRPDGVFSQLTKDQRKDIHEKIKALRGQDASREDIQNAVKTMMESWGIELPEDWDQMPELHPFRHGRMRFMSRLTEDQRKQVRETIRQLKNQNASREDIRAAIRELLIEFGIEPKNSKPKDGNHLNLNHDVEESGLKAMNHPNPFNPETNISYTLQNDEHVKVSIYNVQGQLIRTLVDEIQPAGSYTVRWDGLQENGEKAVSGMYLYQIDAGEETLTQKMILMK